MRSVTRFVLVVALLWGLSATASAGRARFIPTEGHPGLAKIQKRGKLRVRRQGDKIKVKAYVPATRKGVKGAALRSSSRTSTPLTPLRVAGQSFDKAVDIASEQTWRKD